MAELPRASLLENVRFNATAIVPNALQGIFRRRRQAVRAATLANMEGQVVSLLEGMARSYGGRPMWVKVARDDALLMLDPEDIKRLLEGSPEPFASDPKGKRDGMVHFQPDALTISRGDDWRSRRRFAESILGKAPADRTREVAREETERLLSGPVKENDGYLTYQPWNDTHDRITRRVVLGDGAAGDWALTETLARMMSSANSMPGKVSEDLPAFQRRIRAYLERADEGSLAALVPKAPQDERTHPEGQLTHWLFAMGGTIAANSMRCLAALASLPEIRTKALAESDPSYLDACFHEAMRLWPTTNMLARISVEPTDWHGETVPADTQFLILNHYAHRDRERIPYADRFAPEEWTGGDAGDYPGFTHVSRGPQGCPGQALAMLVGRTAIGTVLEHGLEADSPKLDPDKPMPHMIDFFGIKVRSGR